MSIIFHKKTPLFYFQKKGEFFETIKTVYKLIISYQNKHKSKQKQIKAVRTTFTD